MKKLSQYKRIEYLNAIKTVLSKENWKIFRKKYSKNNDMIYKTVKIFHLLGRDKKKINKWFELNEKQNVEILKSINKVIELRRKSIKKLEKIKNGLILEMAKE